MIKIYYGDYWGKIMRLGDKKYKLVVLIVIIGIILILFIIYEISIVIFKVIF